ncbi:MAG: hypothetical protein QXU87_02630 [Candidatus Caldarchaeum sp.]|uniref:DUF2269 family protein n=1 Tax=Caldiarchaeum subterraneum TaxID=311458 RepID=A0A7C5QAQ4_CALS0
MLGYLELAVLKYVHIIGAVMWAGGDSFIVLFLLPSLEKINQQSRSRLAVVLLPRIFRWFLYIGLATVLSGVGLVVYMGLLSLAVLTTRYGAMLFVGGLASLAALLNANIYFKPKGKKLLQMMLNNPETASPEYLENLGKVKRGLTLNVILLWFALLMMTLAGLRL